jgi:hypothetical protein
MSRTRRPHRIKTSRADRLAIGQVYNGLFDLVKRTSQATDLETCLIIDRITRRLAQSFATGRAR